MIDLPPPILLPEGEREETSKARDNTLPEQPGAGLDPCGGVGAGGVGGPGGPPYPPSRDRAALPPVTKAEQCGLSQVQRRILERRRPLSEAWEAWGTARLKLEQLEVTGRAWQLNKERLLDLGYEVVEWAPLSSLQSMAERLKAVTEHATEMTRSEEGLESGKESALEGNKELAELKQQLEDVVSKALALPPFLGSLSS